MRSNWNAARLWSLIPAAVMTFGVVGATLQAGSPAQAERSDREHRSDRDHRSDNRERRSDKERRSDDKHRPFPGRQPAESQLVRLGTKHVDGKSDSDTIRVEGRQRFSQIMLRVTGAPARLRSVVVYFENGEKFRAPTKTDFGQGDRSRIIDLPGQTRDIEKVTFRYGSIRNGRAEVTLFGVRDSGSRSKSQPRIRNRR